MRVWWKVYWSVGASVVKLDATLVCEWVVLMDDE